MTDFDFDNLKATEVKAADIPKFTKTRNIINPLKEQFAKSVAKEDENGYGKWLALQPLPGAPTRSDKGNMNYGPVVTKALGYLSRAAESEGKGLSKNVIVNDDGTVTVQFRSKPRTTRANKAATE